MEGGKGLSGTAEFPIKASLGFSSVFILNLPVPWSMAVNRWEDTVIAYITSILYTLWVCVGHIPTGFLVVEIQYIMYQIQLRL